jgi:hypothetical protein
MRHLWDEGCQKGFMGVEQEFGDVGAPGHGGTSPHYA